MGIPKLIIFIASGIIFLGVFKMPYIYYKILRFYATAIFVWASIISLYRKEKTLFFIFVFLTIVFNPIKNIYLSKGMWVIIDICSGLFLIFISEKIQLLNSNKNQSYMKSKVSKRPIQIKNESKVRKLKLIQDIGDTKSSQYVCNNNINHNKKKENEFNKKKVENEKIRIRNEKKKKLRKIFKEVRNNRNIMKDLSNENLLYLINNQSKFPPITETTYNGYKRSIFISEFVKRKANGICELCRNPAPFKNKFGTPYLENHHIEWLSKFGADTVKNCVALCPNCHKMIHVVNSSKDKMILKEKVKSR